MGESRGFTSETHNGYLHAPSVLQTFSSASVSGVCRGPLPLESINRSRASNGMRSRP